MKHTTAHAVTLSISLTASLLSGCDEAPKPTKTDDKAPATKPAETKPAETKPAETKPAETKPADSKPAENKPAETKSTEAKPSTQPQQDGAKSTDAAQAEKKPFATPQPTLETMEVKLDGKTFKLEQAVNDEQRFRGLSGRTSIADDGGMIFLFKFGSRHNFVMRDCPIPIDIIFVDATGRITAMHNMQPETERTEAEKVMPEDARIPAWARTNDAYEARLKKYSSRYDAIVAIELKGGTLNIEGSNPKGLNLKVGQKLDLDMPALRKKAK
jgi:uncharacterized membrane protein (UPF0127 family)